TDPMELSRHDGVVWRQRVTERRRAGAQGVLPARGTGARRGGRVVRGLRRRARGVSGARPHLGRASNLGGVARSAAAAAGGAAGGGPVARAWRAQRVLPRFPLRSPPRGAAVDVCLTRGVSAHQAAGAVAGAVRVREPGRGAARGVSARARTRGPAVGGVTWGVGGWGAGLAMAG